MITHTIQEIIRYLQTNWIAIISKLLLWIVVFSVLFIVIKYIVSRFEKKLTEGQEPQNNYVNKSSKLLSKILFVVLMIFNILATFEIIGFETALIMWWISLSIWFSMENIIKNTIAWIFILTNQQIKLWYFIEFLGSIKAKGSIEEINLRNTIIRGFDRRRTIIPNSVLAKTPIKTIKTEPMLRWEVEFRVPRNTSFELIKNIFEKVIKSTNNLLYPEHSTVVIENFGSKWVQLRWFFFCDPKKKIPIVLKRELKRKFIEELGKHNIKVPYPHMVVSTEQENSLQG